PNNTELSDHTDSSRPPSVGRPTAVAAAGTATSTNPITMPNPAAAITTVRIPGLTRAPSNRRRSRFVVGPQARTTRLSAKITDPTTIIAAPMTTPSPGHG